MLAGLLERFHLHRAAYRASVDTVAKALLGKVCVLTDEYALNPDMDSHTRLYGTYLAERQLLRSPDAAAGADEFGWEAHSKGIFSNVRGCLLMATSPPPRVLRLPGKGPPKATAPHLRVDILHYRTHQNSTDGHLHPEVIVARKDHTLQNVRRKINHQNGHPAHPRLFVGACSPKTVAVRRSSRSTPGSPMWRPRWGRQRLMVATCSGRERKK